MQGIHQAIAELKRAPQEPALAEVDGLIVELRYRGQRTADDIFEDVGLWEGETGEELKAIIREARSNREEPPRF